MGVVGEHHLGVDFCIRQRGVVTVLIRVRKENGRYRVTGDPYNSVGHFLIVDSINMRTGMVQFAGSTLGMERVHLQEFLQSTQLCDINFKLPPVGNSLG